MSLRFDATGDDLSRTTNLPTITSFTMMAWVYQTVDQNLDTALMMFGATGASTNMYQLGTDSGGTLFNLFNNQGGGLSGTNNFGPTWVHVAITVAGTGAGQFLGYWNGVLHVTQTGDPSATATLMRIGHNGFGEFWNGRVGGIKIYSAVLTATEITTEMNTWAPVRTANLNGWYPCTEATPALCATGKSPGPANDWTIGGTLAIESDPPAAPTVTWEQEGYQWRRDDGTEVTATAIGAQDTPL